MAVCGEKYRHLVRNDRGDTLDSPCAIYCDFHNADSWYRAAIDFPKYVNRWWSAYHKHLREKGQSEDPNLTIAVRRYGEANAQLPEPVWWGLHQFTEQVGLYVDNMVAGACVLEQLDSAMRDVGLQPEKIPGVKPPPTIGDKIGTAVTVGAFALGAFAVWKVAAD